MKILCVSDVISPVVYSSLITSRFEDVDLVLSAGDLDINYYEFIISSLNKPLAFIFGNHNLEYIKKYKKKFLNALDDDSEEEKFKVNNGSIHLGDKVKKVGKLIIAGLGGSMRYNKGDNQYTEFQMFVKIIKLFPKLFFNKILYGRFLDILLTHSPPYGVHDQKDLCHTGFKSFLWFMKMFKPRYLIHGHIHLYDMNSTRVTKYLNTSVVNAYNYVVIDTEGENVSR